MDLTFSRAVPLSVGYPSFSGAGTGNVTLFIADFTVRQVTVAEETVALLQRVCELEAKLSLLECSGDLGQE